MSRADERRQRLPLRGDERFFKGDPLVAAEDGFADSNLPVAIANGTGHMRNFIAPWLALPGCAAELLEGFQKEGLDVVWLQAAGLCSLHGLADAVHAAGIH